MKNTPNRVLKMVIENVVRENYSISSLTKLTKQVKSVLIEKGYRCSNHRIKRIVFDMKSIEVRVSFKKSHIRKGLNGTCPVCGFNLTEILNKTLDGKDVKFYKCKRCKFESEGSYKLPARYIFYYKD
jgi:uncharacterized protein (DUF983 family)